MTRERHDRTGRARRSMALAGALVGAVAVVGPSPVASAQAEGEPTLIEPATSPGAALIRSASLRERCIALLAEAARSETARHRANAIEALEVVGDRAEPILRAGLVDENVGVRSIAALVAGRTGRAELAPFIRPSLRDGSAYVRASAVFAMVKLGEEVDRSPLAEMLLRSPEPSERAHAAFVLGELGDASALPMLRQAARASMPKASINAYEALQLQIAEAMVRLGDEEALQPVRAALFPSRPEGLELTAVAAQVLGRVEDEASAGNLIYLTAYEEEGRLMPPEVRLAAAHALGKMGRREGWFIADEYAAHADPLVRALAAHVYGETDGGQERSKLEAMLDDPAMDVRVAAAASLLRRLERSGDR